LIFIDGLVDLSNSEDAMMAALAGDWLALVS
jgi:hypothetical protein